MLRLVPPHFRKQSNARLSPPLQSNHKEKETKSNIFSALSLTPFISSLFDYDFEERYIDFSIAILCSPRWLIKKKKYIYIWHHHRMFSFLSSVVICIVEKGTHNYLHYLPPSPLSLFLPSSLFSHPLRNKGKRKIERTKLIGTNEKNSRNSPCLPCSA